MIVETVNGDGMSAEEIVGPEVIEAGDVVGVGVGQEDGIHIRQIDSECLGPEVRSAIHENAAVVVFDEDRSAQALVARVGAPADPTITAEGGDSHAGTGSEDIDAHGALILPGSDTGWVRGQEFRDRRAREAIQG
jgi:hypothetical protein